MRQSFIVSIAVIALSAGVAAQAKAQEHAHMEHRNPMPGISGDQRQPVNFPPAMREHTLSNMRDHLQALSEILTAMSGAQYAKAARIAKLRLGLDSPSAEGCKSESESAKVNGAPMMSKPANMEHQMAEVMPEGMRNIGLAMHTAASAFAAEAEKAGKSAGKSGNALPALTALARVTEQCAACHAAYKLQ